MEESVLKSIDKDLLNLERWLFTFLLYKIYHKKAFYIRIYVYKASVVQYGICKINLSIGLRCFFPYMLFIVIGNNFY